MAVGLYSGVSGLALGIGLYRNVSGLWGGASGLIDGFGGADPYAGASLYLNFLNPELDSRITFSRGTNATLIDSTGRLTYAPNNLFLWSQEFDNAAWGKTNATVTANAAIAPDGTTTADAIIPAAGSSVKRVGQGFNATGITAAPFSIFVKANGYNKVALLDPQHTAVGSAVVDLRDGSQANILNTNGTTTVSAVGNGWYRITWVSSAFPPSAVNYTFAVTPLPDSGVTNSFSGAWTANGTDGILVWGAQIERITYQTTSSTYVATTASAYYGPRFDYDPVTLAPRGLLIEEARTNLLTYSEDWTNAAWSKSSCTITANSTSAPTGTAVADTMVSQALTAFTFCLQTVTFASATYTASVFVKAAGAGFVQLLWTGAASADYVNVNVATGAITAGTYAGASVTPFGNGWYRITLTSAIAAGAWGFYIALVDSGSAARAASFTGDGVKGAYLFGAQTELGSFATSYIPTVASTVTRNADVATMTGTNFSSWYNQSEGTLIANASFFGRPASVGNCRIAIISDGTSNNFISAALRNNAASPGMYYGQVLFGGATQALLPASLASDIGDNVVIRSAVGYQTNNFAASANGSTPDTDTSGTVPTVNTLYIGSFNSGTNFANGHIRTIAYFNTRLPNAQLQTLTAPSLAPTLSLDFTSGSYNVGF